MDAAVLQFREAAAAIERLEPLNAYFRSAVEPFGFATYAAGQLDPYDQKRPFMLVSWPKAWLELYAAQGFAAIDIGVREALRQPDPFTWTEIKARFPGASAKIFAAAAEFGWTEGFVVPVHGPGKRRGIVSLAGSGRPISGPERRAVESIALLAYERAREICGSEASAGESLTPREAAVLSLIALGQSDGAIAANLGVSKTTAHFHAENARRKLGAATRAHAVALAITRGLMTL